MIGVIVLLAAIGAVSVWQGDLADWPATALLRDDRPAPPPADLLMLLMGDDRPPTRASTACKAFKDHLASQILIADEAATGFVLLGLQNSAEDATIRYLEQCGVPAAAITLLKGCATDSTIDEARCLATRFRMHGRVERIVLVTSWYHSSRAGYLFEKVLAPVGVKVDVLPAIGERSTPHRWWRQKRNIVAMMSEYVKWVYWLAKGDDGTTPK